ncbi:Hypothetical Protein FCC1311_086542 [Hondaea fermentalgiana]|uniref:GyrI-like small molecule binding domain-containing protein n=1 Tax=Hondaea fermentalgiana TaxID=2315210 RepID=A0A2R5GQ52_9STRA|nr:Hypothetical Protein FCC1311_086542 [Hondaea fermentalgiana]|eukprot:GBG32429.1 Hypothetical Protein FCC1311_086542 [Hondaea fermentalgiana]
MSGVLERVSARAEGVSAWEVAGAAAAVGVAAAVAYAWRLGVFSSMKVEKVERAPMTVAVQSLQCNVADLGGHFERVIGLFNEALPAFKNRHLPLGIYYDDPAALEDPDKLRVDVGVVLLGSDGSSKLDADENEIAKALKPHGLKLATIAKGEFVQGEWPFVNRLSFAIGPMKFYGKAMKIAAEESSIQGWTGSLEIHHMGAKPPYTEYVLPLTQAIQITDFK